ncbi:MAG: hypothetical protein H6Q10_3705, partial [Acidobacteria bacterium]|nr:hypothetical protein [Acidobacteriota bacterium]
MTKTSRISWSIVALLLLGFMLQEPLA